MKIRAIQRILIFNNNCILTAREKIIIGDRTIFGPGVAIFDNDHAYKEKNFEKEFITSPIIIGKNVWIGANSVILRGEYYRR